MKPARRKLQQEILEGRYVLATFLVTSDMDAGPGTLRDAIEQANLLPGTDDVVFDPILDGGQILLSSGELQIDDSLNIIGPSNGLTIDAQQTSSVIHAGYDTTVSLSDLTITGGYVASYYDEFAAGITTNEGDLSINRVTISGNTSHGEDTGGGIHCGFGAVGSISMYDSTISGNESHGAGGVRCGTINVHDSVISGNEGAIGGLWGYAVTIYDSTLSGNTGVGLEPFRYVNATGAVEAKNLVMRDSVVSGNVADLVAGGGYYVSEQAVATETASIIGSNFENNTGGAALRAGSISSGDVDVSNSEFRNNSVGILSYGGLTVTDSTVTGNGTGMRIDGAGAYDPDPLPFSNVFDTVISDNGVGLSVGPDAFARASAKVHLHNSTVSGNTIGLHAHRLGRIYFNDGEIHANQTGAVATGAPEFGGGSIRIHGSQVTENTTTGLHSAEFGFVTIWATTVSGHTNRAILVEGSLGVGSSQIVDNVTTGSGGAIQVTAAGRFSVASSLISGNSATGNGGAIAIMNPCSSCFEDPRVSFIFNTTITDNFSSGRGGGVFEAAGMTGMFISNSTVSGNTAMGNGGGLYLGMPTHASLLTSVTVTNNWAAGNGGGVGVAAHPFRPRPTINTIISGNNDANGSSPDLWDPSGTMEFEYSLVGNNSGSQLVEASPDLDGNLVGGSTNGVIDSELGPLIYNGGPTPTHGLLASSPALNSGDTNGFSSGGYFSVLEFDQRGEGYSRVSGNRIDMGAVEGVALPGDFDDDLQYTCSDVDSLVAEIAIGSDDLMFDINADSFVNTDDLDTWLSIAGAANLPSEAAYELGDANLDGTVDGQDFTIWSNHKFTNSAAWCEGDFDADGVVGGRDFLLWNANKSIPENEKGSKTMRANPKALHAAPEPIHHRIVATLDPLTAGESDDSKLTPLVSDGAELRLVDDGLNANRDALVPHQPKLPFSKELDRRRFEATRSTGATRTQHFHSTVDSVWAERQASEEDADDTEFRFGLSFE